MEPFAHVQERRTLEPSLRLTTVVVPAPAVAAGAAICSAGPALDALPSIAWAPRAGDEDEWSFVGWGTAARVHGAGEERFAEVRARAERVLERLERAPALPFAPRFFGGFAFDPGDGTQPAAAPSVAIAASGSGPAWGAFDDASFALPRFLYACAGDRAFLVAFVPEAEANDALRTLDEIRRTLETPEIEAVPQHDAQCSVGEGGEIAWGELVSRALGEIARGAMAKVVLCRARHLAFSREPDGARVFAVLDARHHECVRFFVRRGAAVFLGATPERLLFVRDRRVVTEALAGSIPRRHDGEDAAARAQLVASAKDRAEHAFVVDAIRDALAPSCDPLTLPPTPEVRSLSHVHHLATPITGRLRERTHVLDLVRLLHPTPALCGSPRAAARAFILANEPAPRGWYGGGVGWFDGRGDGAIAVAIRSALVTARDAWLYAGAGIVRGSDPAHELFETAVKERTMRDALGVPA
jgi:isochorismate synthase